MDGADKLPLLQIIEALLLAVNKPLSIDKILKVFDEENRPDKTEVQKALQQLAIETENRGIELKEVASGWRYQVKVVYKDWVKKLWEEKPQRYTRAMLETLALIAYRQPITRGEIEDIRGVAVSSAIIRAMQERDWIRVVGHREAPGRPAMYATTRQFMDYFNLKNLDELPPLLALKQLDGADEATLSEKITEINKNTVALSETSTKKDNIMPLELESKEALEEENQSSIKKLFNELDQMEKNIKLNYVDYVPNEDKAMINLDNDVDRNNKNLMLIESELDDDEFDDDDFDIDDFEDDDFDEDDDEFDDDDDDLDEEMMIDEEDEDELTS